MNTSNSNPANQTALLRFRAVNWVEGRINDGTALAQALREASARPWPDGELGNYFAVRTIEDWWYAYKIDGFEGLSTKARSDSGAFRKIDEKTAARLIELVEKYPAMALKVWWRQCKKEGELLPPLSTVYRFLRKRGYDKRGIARGRLQSGPTKAFETARVNELWMVDFSPGPKIRDTVSGTLISTQLCVLIDDHSRLIPFAFYGKNANSEAFLHTLKQAVVRRGVPVKLYTDQGKPFVCDHARFVCANLGIRLLHARPYHAWSKGKIERLIRTLQEQFEAGLRLEGESAGSLEALNKKLWIWVETQYHQTLHSSINESPLERYRRAIGTLRYLPADVNIEPLFYTRLKRTVRKDGTVVLGRVLYEVPLHLRGLRVELRYDPFDMERVEVWHDKSLVKLARRANLVINSQLGGDHNYER